MGWNEYKLTKSPWGGRGESNFSSQIATRWQSEMNISSQIRHEVAGLKRMLVHKFATWWHGETYISSKARHEVAGWNE